MNDFQHIELTEVELNSILKIRRARHRILGDGLFSDPAWDILLELLAAKLGNRELALHDLSGFAPSSTLARWIGLLEARKLIRSSSGLIRSPQVHVEISDEGASELIQLLGGVRIFDPNFPSNQVPN